MRRRAERRVVVNGEALGPGLHEVDLDVPGLERRLAVTIAVGARKGPRAFLVGGMAPGDGHGLAVARAALAEIDTSLLAGALVAIGRAAPLEHSVHDAFPGDAQGSPTARLARAVASMVMERAAFGLEVRAGPPGWSTWPHLRADLSDERVARLARAFGAEVIVDGRGNSGSLRTTARAAGVPTLVFEGGEVGRTDPLVIERGAAGLLNLLQARRMLPGAPARPNGRAIVSEVTRVRARRGGWVVPLAAAGARVAAGEGLCALYDETGAPSGVVTAPRRAPRRYVVLATPTAAHIAPQSAIARLGQIRSATRAAPPPPERATIGWCEWVALPELAIARLHAKIDTGARTSALHVLSMRHVGDSGGRQVLELRLPRSRGEADDGPPPRVVVADHVVVRDSGGHAERRPVIETLLVMGPIHRRVRITLTDRGDMLFPMLVGRTALGDSVRVDASTRHLLGDR